MAKFPQESQWTNEKIEDLPWYSDEIKTMTLQAEELFDKYAHIEPSKVKKHIKEFRDRAYAVFPYPCLAQWAFLELHLAASPRYSEVLARVKNGDKYLDLGCCVAQDIRKLVYDGAPSENTYGTDLNGAFMDIGYDLFLDKATLKTTFIAADIFDTDSDLNQMADKMDIVHAASFLHLFNWNDSVKACISIVHLLKSQSGSLFLGRQIGNIEAGEGKGMLRPDRKLYRHTPESFKKMWNEIGEVTDSRWDVDAHFDEQDLYQYALSMNLGDHIAPGSRWLLFSVRRQA